MKVARAGLGFLRKRKTFDKSLIDHTKCIGGTERIVKTNLKIKRRKIISDFMDEEEDDFD